jgi:ABC-type branched-subunit amino acid transport system substrate-binding protein
MQAAKLGVDRDVLGVVGPLSEATLETAGPVLEADGLAWLALVEPAPMEAQMPTGFVDAYRDLAGSDPTPQAAQAYRAANRLLDAIERASRLGPPTRTAVGQALMAEQ